MRSQNARYTAHLSDSFWRNRFSHPFENPRRMYARIAPDLKAPLERKIRKLRITSALKHYPIGVVIFSACAVLFLFTKGHGLTSLVIKVLENRFTEREVITGMGVLITAAVSTGLIYVIRGMIQAPVFEEHFFCGPCNAVDKDDDAICPFCNQALKTKETFFFTFTTTRLTSPRAWASRLATNPRHEREIVGRPPRLPGEANAPPYNPGGKRAVASVERSFEAGCRDHDGAWQRATPRPQAQERRNHPRRRIAVPGSLPSTQSNGLRTPIPGRFITCV